MGNFKPRTVIPPVSIKWYRNQNWGGYSLAISRDDETGYCLPNCVGYANGRQNEAIAEIMGNEQYCNNDMIYDAEQIFDWCKELGRPTVYAPKRGGCMCWSNPATGGHIVFVEEVYDADHVLVTESGYSGAFWFQQTKMNSDNNWTLPWDDYMSYKYQGCVYLPAEVQKVLDGGSEPVIPTSPCGYMKIAYRTMLGDYGYGQERRDKLTKLGFNPDQVDCCVKVWRKAMAYYI